MKNSGNPNDQFSFKPATQEMIAKEISNLRSERAVVYSYDIPTKRPYIKYVGEGPEGFCGVHEIF